MALQQPQCREVENAVGTLQRRIEDIALADVPPDFENTDPRILQCLSKVLLSPTYEIVINHNLGHVFSGQQINSVRAD